MVLRMTVGLALTVVALAVAGRRLWWLRRLAFTGQPRRTGWRRCGRIRAGTRRSQAAEVIGQRKLLKWSVPGAAHAATFWGFIVLLLTIIEAYGDLFDRRFAIPGIGHWAAIGFIEDLFAVGVLAGIITFTVIRVRSSPRREGRGSRFFGSHTRAAWVVLGMIFLVIVTLLVYRGAQEDTGVFPYPHAWAFASWVVAQVLHPLGSGVNSVLEAVFLLAQIGGDHGVRGDRGVLQAPAHRAGPGERAVLPPPRRAGPAGADARRTGRCWTSRRPTRIPTCSGWGRSRTSPGRACWTWRPARSAGGASRSARRGRPASRCPPSR